MCVGGETVTLGKRLGEIKQVRVWEHLRDNFQLVLRPLVRLHRILRFALSLTMDSKRKNSDAAGASKTKRFRNGFHLKEKI